MRILHVLDHSLPLHSGYAFRTAAILREQHALGWETVQVTTPRQQSASAYEDAEGWRFHRTHLESSALDKVPGARYFREMAATQRRIAELAETFRPDVIHAHSPVLNAIPALRFARKARLPVVYELRALWEAELAGGSSKWRFWSGECTGQRLLKGEVRGGRGCPSRACSRG